MVDPYFLLQCVSSFGFDFSCLFSDSIKNGYCIAMFQCLFKVLLHFESKVGHGSKYVGYV